MGIFDGWLICTDIDGTLTGDDGKVSRENLDAISYFKSEGGLFTVSTGRPAHYIADRFGFSVNAPVIAVNGTVIYDLEEEKLLADFPMDVEDSFEVIDFLLKEYPGEIREFILWGLDAGINVRGAGCTFESIKAEFSGKPGYKEVFPFFDSGKAYEAMLRLRESFGERFGVVRSWPEGLEIFDSRAGKGRCVKLLKERFCEGIHTTVAIGDFENDETMLRDADIGYAVANALDSVKAAADRLTVSYSESAIAAVVDELKKKR